MNKTRIPIFYACDEAFINYAVVSLHSLMENASRDYSYSVCFLHKGISKASMEKVFALRREGFDISFEDVSGYLKGQEERFPIRDYYSRTTYYRFFISEMFPGYDKAIYIDADTVVNGDISRLYHTDIGDCYVGACHEQAMVQVEEYGRYVEQVVGVDRHAYFNAGMLLINCKKFREGRVLDKFIEYLGIYNFVVTQDEDYLNLICKDRVFWLDSRWNTEIFGELPHPIEESCIIHYIMTSKPWHYRDCRHGEYFWRYARETAVYKEILEELDSYTDEERERDAACCDNLLALAARETEREDSFLKIVKSLRDSGRNSVLERIDELEREGRFDEDVECDPPTRVLEADEIDYLARGPVRRARRWVAYSLARCFVRRLQRQGKLIIKDVLGIENLKRLHTGAIITCNHFNPHDSFAMQIAYEKGRGRRRRLWRVIREGNYTSFGGFYGFLMRNCNTLPLSSSAATMRKMMKSTLTLLGLGEHVLIYPEQSMWWNYRKPKPLKEGAYYLAARASVPVLPCFITMRDTDTLGEDGFPIQEYTVHIGEPIYPREGVSASENTEYLMTENARVWREIYESTYGIPLRYTTKTTVKA